MNLCFNCVVNEEIGQQSSKSKNKLSFEPIDSTTAPILKSTEMETEVAPEMPNEVNPESAEDGSDDLKCSGSEVSNFS